VDQSQSHWLVKSLIPWVPFWLLLPAETLYHYSSRSKRFRVGSQRVRNSDPWQKVSLFVTQGLGYGWSDREIRGEIDRQMEEHFCTHYTTHQTDVSEELVTVVAHESNWIFRTTLKDRSDEIFITTAGTSIRGWRTLIWQRFSRTIPHGGVEWEFNWGRNTLDLSQQVNKRQRSPSFQETQPNEKLMEARTEELNIKIEIWRSFIKHQASIWSSWSERNSFRLHNSKQSTPFELLSPSFPFCVSLFLLTSHLLLRNHRSSSN